MENNGSRTWFIPDGFLPLLSNGEYNSHEAICVMNTTKEDADLHIVLYFEDRDKMDGFSAVCKSERTNHVRLDRIENSNGEKIPVGIPYAIMIKSNVNIIVQHSRMDTTQAEMALMTTIAFPG